MLSSLQVKNQINTRLPSIVYGPISQRLLQSSYKGPYVT